MCEGKEQRGKDRKVQKHLKRAPVKEKEKGKEVEQRYTL